MTWPPKMIDIIMRVPVMCYCIKLKLPRPLVRVRGTFIFKKMKIFEFLPKLFDWNRIFQPGTKQAGIPLLNIWNDNYQEIQSYDEQPKRCGALFGTPNVGALRARLLYTMPVSSRWKTPTFHYQTHWNLACTYKCTHWFGIDKSWPWKSKCLTIFD